MAFFARQLDVKIENNTIQLPGSVGQGVIQQFHPIKEIAVSYMHLKLYEPVILIRKPAKSSARFPIMIYNQELEGKQEIGGQVKIIGRNTPNGIFVPSPQIGTRWEMPVNAWISQLTLGIDKKWLLSLVDEEKANYVTQLLKNKKPYYIFESLTPQMLREIETIHELIGRKGQPLINLHLHNKSLELILLFLEKLVQRTSEGATAILNQKDVEKLFFIRKEILENLENAPPLKQLAYQAGMSVSKLQKSFKQIFGKSISQFALHEKMQLAKQKLGSKKYSVSEVGYSLGYSNLSHFSNAFKNQFGLNPKKYLSSLK